MISLNGDNHAHCPVLHVCSISAAEGATWELATIIIDKYSSGIAIVQIKGY